MSNPEPEAEPVVPQTIPDRDLGLGPMTPEQFRRVLSRRYPSTGDVARYLTRHRRVPTNGRVVAGEQPRAAATDDAATDDTEGFGIVVKMPTRSLDYTDGGSIRMSGATRGGPG